MTTDVAVLRMRLDLLTDEFDRKHALVKQRVNNLEKSAVAPKIDAKQLHDLNRLYDQKLVHHKQVATFVAANPIAPTVDTRNLTAGINQVRAFKTELAAVKSQIGAMGANVGTSIDQRVTVDFGRLDSRMAYEIRSLHNDISKDFGRVVDAIAGLKPSLISRVASFGFKTATAPLRVAGSIGGDILRGYLEGIGSSAGFRTGAGIQSTMGVDFTGIGTITGKDLKVKIKQLGDFLDYLSGDVLGFTDGLSGAANRIKKRFDSIYTNVLDPKIYDEIETALVRGYMAKDTFSVKRADFTDKQKRLRQLFDDSVKAVLGRFATDIEESVADFASALIKVGSIPVRMRKRVINNESAFKVNDQVKMFQSEYASSPARQQIQESEGFLFFVGGTDPKESKPGSPNVESTYWNAAAMRSLAPKSYLETVSPYHSLSVEKMDEGVYAKAIRGKLLPFIEENREFLANVFDPKDIDNLIANIKQYHPFEILAEQNLGKGYNEDAMRLATKVVAAGMEFPDKPLTIGSVSGGGVIVEEAINIINEMAKLYPQFQEVAARVKGFGMGMPMAGLTSPLKPDDPAQFMSFVGNLDNLAKGFFGRGIYQNTPDLDADTLAQLEGQLGLPTGFIKPDSPTMKMIANWGEKHDVRKMMASMADPFSEFSILLNDFITGQGKMTTDQASQLVGIVKSLKSGVDTGKGFSTLKDYIKQLESAFDDLQEIEKSTGKKIDSIEEVSSIISKLKAADKNGILGGLNLNEINESLLNAISNEYGLVGGFTRAVGGGKQSAAATSGWQDLIGILSTLAKAITGNALVSGSEFDFADPYFESLATAKAMLTANAEQLNLPVGDSGGLLQFYNKYKPMEVPLRKNTGGQISKEDESAMQTIWEDFLAQLLSIDEQYGTKYFEEASSGKEKGIAQFLWDSSKIAILYNQPSFGEMMESYRNTSFEGEQGKAMEEALLRFFDLYKKEAEIVQNEYIKKGIELLESNDLEGFANLIETSTFSPLKETLGMLKNIKAKGKSGALGIDVNADILGSFVDEIRAAIVDYVISEEKNADPLKEILDKYSGISPKIDEMLVASTGTYKSRIPDSLSTQEIDDLLKLIGQKDSPIQSLDDLIFYLVGDRVKPQVDYSPTVKPRISQQKNNAISQIEQELPFVGKPSPVAGSADSLQVVVDTDNIVDSGEKNWKISHDLNRSTNEILEAIRQLLNQRFSGGGRDDDDGGSAVPLGSLVPRKPDGGAELVVVGDNPPPDSPPAGVLALPDNADIRKGLQTAIWTTMDSLKKYYGGLANAEKEFLSKIPKGEQTAGLIKALLPAGMIGGGLAEAGLLDDYVLGFQHVFEHIFNAIGSQGIDVLMQNVDKDVADILQAIYNTADSTLKTDATGFGSGITNALNKLELDLLRKFLNLIKGLSDGGQATAEAVLRGIAQVGSDVAGQGVGGAAALGTAVVAGELGKNVAKEGLSYAETNAVIQQAPAADRTAIKSSDANETRMAVKTTAGAFKERYEGIAGGYDLRQSLLKAGAPLSPEDLVKMLDANRVERFGLAGIIQSTRNNKDLIPDVRNAKGEIRSGDNALQVMRRKLGSLDTQFAAMMKQLVAQAKEAGLQLPAGLEEGIKQYSGRMEATAKKELGVDLIKTIKDVFGISSPSKVFELIGKDLIAGLAKGLTGFEGTLAEKEALLETYVKSFIDLVYSLDKKGNDSKRGQQFRSAFDEIVREKDGSRLAEKTRLLLDKMPSAVIPEPSDKPFGAPVVVASYDPDVNAIELNPEARTSHPVEVFTHELTHFLQYDPKNGAFNPGALSTRGQRLSPDSDEVVERVEGSTAGIRRTLGYRLRELISRGDVMMDFDAIEHGLKKRVEWLDTLEKLEDEAYRNGLSALRDYEKRGGLFLSDKAKSTKDGSYQRKTTGGIDGLSDLSGLIASIVDSIKKMSLDVADGTKEAVGNLLSGKTLLSIARDIKNNERSEGRLMLQKEIGGVELQPGRNAYKNLREMVASNASEIDIAKFLKENLKDYKKFGIKDGFSDSIGKDLTDGAVKGADFNPVNKFFVDGFKRLVSHVKQFLGIASPSKVFIEIGKNIVLGYEAGITGAAKNLKLMKLPAPEVEALGYKPELDEQRIREIKEIWEGKGSEQDKMAASTKNLADPIYGWYVRTQSDHDVLTGIANEGYWPQNHSLRLQTYEDQYRPSSARSRDAVYGAWIRKGSDEVNSEWWKQYGDAILVPEFAPENMLIHPGDSGSHQSTVPIAANYANLQAAKKYQQEKDFDYTEGILFDRLKIKKIIIDPTELTSFEQRTADELAKLGIKVSIQGEVVDSTFAPDLGLIRQKDIEHQSKMMQTFYAHTPTAIGDVDPMMFSAAWPSPDVRKMGLVANNYLSGEKGSGDKWGELNRLIHNAYNRGDGHFWYDEKTKQIRQKNLTDEQFSDDFANTAMNSSPDFVKRYIDSSGVPVGELRKTFAGSAKEHLEYLRRNQDMPANKLLDHSVPITAVSLQKKISDGNHLPSAYRDNLNVTDENFYRKAQLDYKYEPKKLANYLYTSFRGDMDYGADISAIQKMALDFQKAFKNAVFTVKQAFRESQSAPDFYAATKKFVDTGNPSDLPNDIYFDLKDRQKTFQKVASIDPSQGMGAKTSALYGSYVGDSYKYKNASLPDELKRNFAKAGMFIGAGLTEGINQGSRSPIAAIGNFANQLIATAKKILGIASPSRVFMRIGKYIVEGLQQGISVNTLLGNLQSDLQGEIAELVAETRNVRAQYPPGWANESDEDYQAFVQQQLQYANQMEQILPNFGDFFSDADQFISGLQTFFQAMGATIGEQKVGMADAMQGLYDARWGWGMPDDPQEAAGQRAQIASQLVNRFANPAGMFVGTTPVNQPAPAPAPTPTTIPPLGSLESQSGQILDMLNSGVGNLSNAIDDAASAIGNAAEGVNQVVSAYGNIPLPPPPPQNTPQSPTPPAPTPYGQMPIHPWLQDEPVVLPNGGAVNFRALGQDVAHLMWGQGSSQPSGTPTAVSSGNGAATVPVVPTPTVPFTPLVSSGAPPSGSWVGSPPFGGGTGGGPPTVPPTGFPSGFPTGVPSGVPTGIVTGADPATPTGAPTGWNPNERFVRNVANQGVRAVQRIPTDSFERFFVWLNQQLDHMEIAAEEAGEGVRGLGRIIGALEEKHPGVRRLVGTIRDIGVGILFWLGLDQIDQLLVNFAQSSVDAALQVERFKVALSYDLTGSGTSGLQKIRDLSQEIGANFLVTADNYSKLVIAAANTNVAPQVDSITAGFTKALVAQGATPEQQSRAFLAVQQMIGKNQIMGEELRQQLAEVMPQATGALARAKGVSQQQLVRDMQNTPLLPEEELLPLAKQLEYESTIPLMTYRSGPLPKVAGIQNEYQRMQQGAGEALLGIANAGGLQATNAVLGLLADNIKIITGAAAMMGLLFTGKLVVAMLRFGSATRIASLLLKTLGLEFLAVNTVANAWNGTIGTMNAKLIISKGAMGAATGAMSLLFNVMKMAAPFLAISAGVALISKAWGSYRTELVKVAEQSEKTLQQLIRNSKIPGLESPEDKQRRENNKNNFALSFLGDNLPLRLLSQATPANLLSFGRLDFSRGLGNAFGAFDTVDEDGNKVSIFDRNATLTNRRAADRQIEVSGALAGVASSILTTDKLGQLNQQVMQNQIERSQIRSEQANAALDPSTSAAKYLELEKRMADNAKKQAEIFEAFGATPAILEATIQANKKNVEELESKPRTDETREQIQKLNDQTAVINTLLTQINNATAGINLNTAAINANMRSVSSMASNRRAEANLIANRESGNATKDYVAGRINVVDLQFQQQAIAVNQAENNARTADEETKKVFEQFRAAPQFDEQLKTLFKNPNVRVNLDDYGGDGLKALMSLSSETLQKLSEEAAGIDKEFAQWASAAITAITAQVDAEKNVAEAYRAQKELTEQRLIELNQIQSNIALLNTNARIDADYNAGRIGEPDVAVRKAKAALKKAQDDLTNALKAQQDIQKDGDPAKLQEAVNQANAQVESAKSAVINSQRALEDAYRGQKVAIEDYNQSVYDNVLQINRQLRDYSWEEEDTFIRIQRETRDLNEAWEQLLFTLDTRLLEAQNALLDSQDKIAQLQRRIFIEESSPFSENIGRKAATIIADYLDAIDSSESATRNLDQEQRAISQEYVDTLKNIRTEVEKQYDAERERNRTLIRLNERYMDLIIAVDKAILDSARRAKELGVNVERTTPGLSESIVAPIQRSTFNVPAAGASQSNNNYVGNQVGFGITYQNGQAIVTKAAAVPYDGPIDSVPGDFRRPAPIYGGEVVTPAPVYEQPQEQRYPVRNGSGLQGYYTAGEIRQMGLSSPAVPQTSANGVLTSVNPQTGEVFYPRGRNWVEGSGNVTPDPAPPSERPFNAGAYSRGDVNIFSDYEQHNIGGGIKSPPPPPPPPKPQAQTQQPWLKAQDVISPNTLKAFVQLVAAESGNQSMAGVVATALTILNRYALIATGKAPLGTAGWGVQDKSLMSVMTARRPNGQYEFSPYNDGRINNTFSPNVLAKALQGIENAINIAYAGNREVSQRLSIGSYTANLTNFRHHKLGPERAVWRGQHTRVGDHIFGQDKYSIGKDLPRINFDMFQQRGGVPISRLNFGIPESIELGQTAQAASPQQMQGWFDFNNPFFGVFDTINQETGKRETPGLVKWINDVLLMPFGENGMLNYFSTTKTPPAPPKIEEPIKNYPNAGATFTKPSTPFTPNVATPKVNAPGPAINPQQQYNVGGGSDAQLSQQFKVGNVITGGSGNFTDPAPIQVRDPGGAFNKAKALIQVKLNTILSKRNEAMEQLRLDTIEFYNGFVNLYQELEDKQLKLERDIADGNQTLKQMRVDAKGFITDPESVVRAGDDVTKRFRDLKASAVDTNRQLQREIDRSNVALAKAEAMLAKGTDSRGNALTKEKIENAQNMIDGTKVYVEQLGKQKEALWGIYQQEAALEEQTRRTTMEMAAREKVLAGQQSYANKLAELFQTRFDVGAQNDWGLGTLLNKAPIVKAQLDALVADDALRKLGEQGILDPEAYARFSQFQKEINDLNLERSFVEAIPGLEAFSSELRNVILESESLGAAAQKMGNVILGIFTEALVIKPLQNWIGSLVGPLLGFNDPGLKPISTTLGAGLAQQPGQEGTVTGLAAGVFTQMAGNVNLPVFNKESGNAISKSAEALASSFTDYGMVQELSTANFNASLLNATLAVNTFAAALNASVGGNLISSVTSSSGSNWLGAAAQGASIIASALSGNWLGAAVQGASFITSTLSGSDPSFGSLSLPAYTAANPSAFDITGSFDFFPGEILNFADGGLIEDAVNRERMMAIEDAMRRERTMSGGKQPILAVLNTDEYVIPANEANEYLNYRSWKDIKSNDVKIKNYANGGFTKSNRMTLNQQNNTSGGNTNNFYNNTTITVKNPNDIGLSARQIERQRKLAAERTML